MEKLTNKEEEILRVLWKIEKGFVKEVLAEIKDQKLHYNTVSTIIRNLEEKNTWVIKPSEKPTSIIRWFPRSNIASSS